MPWDAVDQFVANVYGFTKADRQLVDDALRFELPHKKAHTFACSRPADSDVNKYVATLQRMLTPYSGSDMKQVSIERAIEYDSESWRFFRIHLDREEMGKQASTRTHGKSVKPESPDTIQGVSVIADLISEPFWSSQVRIQLGAGDWLIGQLAQRRYWSRTKARMLALEWIESDLTGVA
jgi:hypothetical protein